MKKVRFLLVLLLTTVAIACDKEEFPEGEGRIRVHVSVYDAFANLTDSHGNPWFDGTLPDDYRIRVHAFLYRNEKEGGILAGTEVTYLDDIRKEAYFWLDAKPGNYTVIATADIVSLTNGKYVDTCNNITADRMNARIDITTRVYGGLLNAAGYTLSGGFDLDEGTGKVKVSLTAKPAGTLVTFCFCGVAPSKSGENYLELPIMKLFRLFYIPSVDDFFLTKSNDQMCGYTLPADVDRTTRIQSYVVPGGEAFRLYWQSPTMLYLTAIHLPEAENVFVKVDLEERETEVYGVFPDWAKCR